MPSRMVAWLSIVYLRRDSSYSPQCCRSIDAKIDKIVIFSCLGHIGLIGKVSLLFQPKCQNAIRFGLLCNLALSKTSKFWLFPIQQRYSFVRLRTATLSRFCHWKPWGGFYLKVPKATENMALGLAVARLICWRLWMMMLMVHSIWFRP